jgi:hypothetical protein
MGAGFADEITPCASHCRVKRAYEFISSRWPWRTGVGATEQDDLEPELSAEGAAAVSLA